MQYHTISRNSTFFLNHCTVQYITNVWRIYYHVGKGAKELRKIRSYSRFMLDFDLWSLDFAALSKYTYGIHMAWLAYVHKFIIIYAADDDM